MCIWLLSVGKNRSRTSFCFVGYPIPADEIACLVRVQFFVLLLLLAVRPSRLTPRSWQGNPGRAAGLAAPHTVHGCCRSHNSGEQAVVCSRQPQAFLYVRNVCVAIDFFFIICFILSFAFSSHLPRGCKTEAVRRARGWWCAVSVELGDACRRVGAFLNQTAGCSGDTPALPPVV